MAEANPSKARSASVVAMLACSSIGAIWSSCSPDFGINGVIDRFGQIEPKVLFACNGYYYNGTTTFGGDPVGSAIALILVLGILGFFCCVIICAVILRKANKYVDDMEDGGQKTSKTDKFIATTNVEA